MTHCCGADEAEFAGRRGRQSRVLWAVFGINAGMFVLEFAAGILASSTALQADSLDMMGDAFVYGLSLYALQRSERWRAGAALVKGVIMGAFAAGITADAAVKTIRGVTPTAELMGVVGALALLANLVCLGLLVRHRGDDLNMRSVWLCSRNDVLANAGVLLAAAAVWLTGSLWPDVVLGLAIAALFLRSAVEVTRASARALRSLPVGGA